MRVLRRQEEEEDRSRAVQVARRRRLPLVLLRGAPAGRVDDRAAASRELVELLLRRPEVDQHHLPVGVEDDVLRLDVPVDDVALVKVRQRLQELEDVPPGGRFVGWLVMVSFRKGLPVQLLLDEAEGSKVCPLVDIPHDPRMAGRADRPQDVGLDVESFLGLREVGATGLLDDDFLTAVGLADIDGRHPALAQLADDFIAILPAFQSARNREGHAIRTPISSRTVSSPTLQRRSHRHLGARCGPCR